MHEVFEVGVDRTGEVHDVPGVAVGDDGEHEQLIGDFFAGTVRDSDGADEVDIQRQVRPVLLDGPARHDADLLQVDGVVDLRPGELLIAVFGRCAAHGTFLGNFRRWGGVGTVSSDEGDR